MPLTLDELERRAYITNDQATLAVIATAERSRSNQSEAYGAGYAHGIRRAREEVAKAESRDEAFIRLARL